MVNRTTISILQTPEKLPKWYLKTHGIYYGIKICFDCLYNAYGKRKYTQK